MNQSSFKLIIAAVALVAGLGAGYFYGNSVGIAQGVAQEKKAEDARKAEAEKAVVQSVNPFNQTTANPFSQTQTNPFNNVKVNPFK